MDKAVFWFRRDLRLEDNTGLAAALKSGLEVIPLFIFDKNILGQLDNPEDARVTYIHRAISNLNIKLRKEKSALQVYHGDPGSIFHDLLQDNSIRAVYTNRDYEPDTRERDQDVRQVCDRAGVPFFDFKDHVTYEFTEVLKDDGKPYHVFTPYKRKWLTRFHASPGITREVEMPAEGRYIIVENPPPILQLSDIGFNDTSIGLPSPSLPDPGLVHNYGKTRDFPAYETTRIGIHLRFGTLSIRQAMSFAAEHSEAWMNELIWREFFMQILAHYPRVVEESFKPEYERINWRNDEREFDLWCRGETGFPLVDAGMRELNATGFMHNRVRMIVASFLVKDLLIDWRWGEAYFAAKLLDFELAANNGNWQWVAGTGCDAAPYFRVFNPETQARNFDPHFEYIRKWVPEMDSLAYPEPMVDHRFARERALTAYKNALK